MFNKGESVRIVHGSESGDVGEITGLDDYGYLVQFDTGEFYWYDEEQVEKIHGR